MAGATIWTRPDRGARGPRPRHSRAAIAAAGVALADTGGLAAVSMRAVAEALGTGAGTLYRYLSSRDDLLDLMTDAVLAELPLDRQPGDDWLDDVVAVAHDQLALHRRHPWLLETSRRRGAIGPRATDLFEQYLRLLVPVGRDVTTKLEAVAMVAGVVSLFARTTSPAQQATSPSQLFAAATRHGHPHLSAALGRSGPPAPRPDLFERTVRGVLGGLLVDGPDVARTNPVDHRQADR